MERTLDGVRDWLVGVGVGLVGVMGRCRGGVVVRVLEVWVGVNGGVTRAEGSLLRTRIRVQHRTRLSGICRVFRVIVGDLHTGISILG